MIIYNSNDNLKPVILTGKERDVIVNILKTVEINRFGDAFIAMDVVDRLIEL